MNRPAFMRALVLRGRGFENLAIETVPVPAPGPGQALVRVDAAGICASLIKLIEQGNDHTYLYGWDLGLYPAILGDEGSVILVEKGAGMPDTLTEGSRYVVQPAVDAAPTTFRERYRDNAVSVAKIACGYTLPGHLAEYMLLPEEVFAAKCLVPIPDATLPLAHAAISEPISCCVSAQFHHMHLSQADLTGPRTAVSGLKRGGTVVVVGLGAMGRMQVDTALAHRPSVIIASDPQESRRARTELIFQGKARSQETQLLCVAPGQLAQTVMDITAARGADDLIIAVGHGGVIEESLPLLGRGGVANLFGGLKRGEEMIQVDANAIHYHETVVTGSSGGTAWDIAQTLEWMCSGAIDASKHIARIGDLDHAMDLIKAVRAQEIDGKAVVYPHRRSETLLSVDQWTAEDEAAYLKGTD